MISSMKAWQCIGCGRIDSPQNCIGVCQDRKVELVYASEHAEALERVADAERRASAFVSLVRQFASTTPRNGRWEASYRELQQKARWLVSELHCERRSPVASPDAAVAR